MQKHKTFSRANEERQQLQNTVVRFGKAMPPSLDNLEHALAVEGLTDDVNKEELKWSRKFGIL